MASIWPTSVSVQTIVLGNILAISDEDVVQVAIISAVSLAVLALKWKDLMVTFFDESHARSLGLNTGLLKVLFFTLLSACTVAALQTVGACLVVAMVVTPGATAYLLDRPVRPADRHQRRHRRDHQLRRRLYQLLPRRRDRRRDRHAADAAVPRGVLLRAQARHRWPRAGAGWRLRDAPHDGARSTGSRCRCSYPFMQRALIVSVLVGAVCAVLSCYLVLKGWSLMGDAISHAVLPGIVIAYVLGLPLALGAFAAGLVLRAARPAI